MSEKVKVLLCVAVCMTIVIIAVVMFSTSKDTKDYGDTQDYTFVHEQEYNQEEYSIYAHDYDYPTYAGGEDMNRNRRITASQAKDLMTRYPDAIILDVRSEYEFATGHVPGAILLPSFDIEYTVNSIVSDNYALILVYCQSGNRSRSATSLLVSMGYVNVYDFGGISSWPYGVEY